MKKTKFFAMFLGFGFALGTAFAASPESDFEYDLYNHNEDKVYRTKVFYETYKVPKTEKSQKSYKTGKLNTYVDVPDYNQNVHKEYKKDVNGWEVGSELKDVLIETEIPEGIEGDCVVITKYLGNDDVI